MLSRGGRLAHGLGKAARWKRMIPLTRMPRMLAPAIPHCFQPKLHADVGSRRSLLSETNNVFQAMMEAGEAFMLVLSILSNVDGTIGLANRAAKPLQARWGEFRSWSQTQQDHHPACPELELQITETFQKMSGAVGKLHDKASLPPGAFAEIQRMMFEQFVNLVIYQLVARCKHSRCRIVQGVPIIYCWEGVSIVQSLSDTLSCIPDVHRPVCQPMCDVDVGQLKQSQAFRKVLECLQIEINEWQEVPNADDPAFEGISILKEQQIKRQEPEVFPSGAVRRLEHVHDFLAEHVASSEGLVYVSGTMNKKPAIVRYGVGGVLHLTSEHLYKNMAVDGDVVIGTPNSTTMLMTSDSFFCAKILGTGAEVFIEQFIVADYQKLTAFSLTDSTAYFCVGHAVFSFDLETRHVHQIIGRCGQPGRGCTGSPPRDLLLRRPSDTAVSGSMLFVADCGNGRVLCVDMENKNVDIVFEGSKLTWTEAYFGSWMYRIAASHDCLYVYDRGQNKIFHVSFGTWEVRHILGTGIRGHSPDGLPPLSTNLQQIESMAVGHDGELVFLSDDGVLRGFKMPELVACEMLPAGPLSATYVPLLNHSEEPGALVPLGGSDLEPTCGAKWKPFSPGLNLMYVSEALQHDKKHFTLKVKMTCPTHGLGICLVTEASGPLDEKPVDTHIFSSPTRSKQTYVTTLSQLRKTEELATQPFRKAWKAALSTFRAIADKIQNSSGSLLSEPFHFRKTNDVEVVMERSYNAGADSSTWKLVKVKINGKERAGDLEPLTLGVDVGVRICMFAAEEGGFLHFLDEPKIVS